jgi:hypothetical protein
VKRARSLLLLSPFAALAAATGCGDVYADPQPETTTIPAEDEDAATPMAEAPPMACPPSRPRENSTCAVPGSVCEYGTSADQECNTILVCRGVLPESYWEALPSSSCRKHVCPTDANVASLDGKPCALEQGADAEPITDADEAVCNMSDGVCACTTGRDGATAHERKWICVKPVTSCPPNRPLAGQACRGNSWCDYGSCSSKRGLLMECIGSIWRMGGATCQ